MLIPVRATQFKRDVRKAKKRGKDLTKLRGLLDSLIRQRSIPARYIDHQLQGTGRGYREAHIEPDWLLIYRVEGNELYLARAGSHSESL